MKKLILTLFMFLSMTAMGEETRNPVQFAADNAPGLIESQSDTGRSSFDGCEIVSKATKQIRIECTGEAEVLVHGGHPYMASVSCVFDFTKVRRKKWTVEYDCR